MEPLGQHKLSFSPAESRAMLSNAQWSSHWIIKHT
jgi:hypothetical protein